MGSYLLWSVSIVISLLLASANGASVARQPRDEKFRPQFHFSVPENWLNDPNGMVYYDGEYHLYYQYHPYSTQWGPMHWGHAVSPDLLRWTHLPIALYPDELGDIFSGSAVVDLNNSTGFQADPAVAPIVAIFTHAGASQQQSIAYSNDKGRTFTKYPGNPVIPNPGIVDFRDPKVIPYNDGWVLVLAAGNKVIFYKSADLKSWELASEFGAEPEQGHHGGVWECPDLVQVDGAWILILSSGGGPNGGSVSQYFVGSFDGTTYSSPQMEPRWLDWGTDNYAGVSFSNDPLGRSIYMGWMSNWDYAGAIPTEGWRGQMTLPRQLVLEDGAWVGSVPAFEAEHIFDPEQIQIYYEEVEIGPELTLPLQYEWSNELLFNYFAFNISEFGAESSIAICYLNEIEGQELCTGFDNGRERNVFLDRARSGNVGFSDRFNTRPTATLELGPNDHTLEITVFLDVSAIEVTVNGHVALTSLFYPDVPFSSIEIRHHAAENQQSKLVMVGGQVRGLLAQL